MSTNVECCSARESVQEAARRMRSRNVGFLPVLDDASRLIGTLTDRDIAVRVVAEGLPLETTRVADVMSTGVVFCHPSDPVELAAARMIEFKKWRVLCVDESGSPQGVISLADIAEIESAQRAGDVLRYVSSREVRPH